jgi:predicted Ser/Thr protein kinase
MARVCHACGTRLLPLERRCPRCNTRNIPGAPADTPSGADATSATVHQAPRETDAIISTVESRSLDTAGLATREEMRNLVLRRVVLTHDGQVLRHHNEQCLSSLAAEFGASNVVLDDRYALVREIGRGGTGLVFLGEDRRLDRLVAVKIMAARVDGMPDERRQEHWRSFHEEARLVANLTHPQIATVYDLGTWRGMPYMVFEYVAGETLRELLQRRTRLSLPEVLEQFLAPIALALDFAHRRGVVHRDLKPENIRLTPEGHYKILDLGVARDFAQQRDWRFMGTPAYAAPEQAAELPCDGRADQYALALIVYELLAGRRAFQADDVHELLRLQRECPLPDPRGWLAGLSDSVWEVLQRALSKDPTLRFSSCQDFAVALGCQYLHANGQDDACFEAEAEVFSLAGLIRLRLGYRQIAISEQALWVNDEEAVTRYPLALLTSCRTSCGGRLMRVAFRNAEERDVCDRFLFRQSSLGRRFYEHLHEYLRRRLADPIDDSTDVQPDWMDYTIPLLPQRPNVPCQILGLVESQGVAGRAVRERIQLQAAFRGGQAVVQFRREREGRRHRASGFAIRLVDPEGLREVYLRWADEECGRLGKRILHWTLLALLLLGLQNKPLATIYDIPYVWLQAATVFQLLLPALLGYAVWRWRWPHLLSAVRLSLAIWSLAPLVTGLCAVLAVFSQVDPQFTHLDQWIWVMVSWLNPVHLALLPFALRLARAADRLDDLCSALVTGGEEQKEVTKLSAESWAMIMVQVFGISYLIQAAWSLFRSVDLVVTLLLLLR